MENHSYSQIIGSASAPYINSLAQQGALFTDSHAVTHPSEPNYLAFFSGSTQGLTDDSCPHTYSSANLASELIAAGLTFGGYSEDLPSVGSTVCTSGAYARKHNPWVNFTNVPSNANMPFTSFPSDPSLLPTVAIVVPNQNNDMHDGTIQQADTWLKQHIDPYLQWAWTHNSLLIVTWDEDDFTSVNRIPTIFVGPMVQPGQYGETINHYNVLRTLEDMYGLGHAGASATAAPITDIWVGSPGEDTTPPVPNPMTWASRPAATGSTTVAMTATTASDPSGVEYFFGCVAGTCHPSGWQASPTYTDTGLKAGATYTYQVKARDLSAGANETAWSTQASVTTPSMHVQGISLSTVNRGGGLKSGSAKVTIQDQRGKAVPGAIVTGQFTGSFNEVVSATTNSSGVALLVTVGQAPTSTFTFCVVDVTHPTLGYNAAANRKTCAKR
ncbi:MAG: hypothetical protein DMD81_06515 [Candidatus Rokuibacteriota bacterium]|nr:MAG: hypothetical protein DMD81_06515 [Candidatus Rokubacteria bacterium]